MTVQIDIVWEDWADQSLGLPSYETAGAAGADLRANLSDRKTITLAPMQRALIPTGLRMAIPDGYEVQIRPRSGLALKHGITLLNTPGTIDSDYRGPLGIIVINLSDADFEISHGMRIAQMIVAPVVQARFAVTTSLDHTSRSAGGFGSTGL